MNQPVNLAQALGVTAIERIEIVSDSPRVVRAVTDRPTLDAVLVCLRELPATSGEMIKLRVLSAHRLVIHRPGAESVELKAYNASLLQSPIDTSVIDKGGNLLRLLAIPKP